MRPEAASTRRTGSSTAGGQPTGTGYSLSGDYVQYIAEKDKVQVLLLEKLYIHLKVATNEKGDASSAVLNILCWWGTQC
jgi:hypothetical protein